MTNAVATRNRELLSISGYRVRAAAGVARGVTPLCFFRGKSRRFEGCFYSRDLFYRMASVSPLTSTVKESVSSGTDDLVLVLSGAADF